MRAVDSNIPLRVLVPDDPDQAAQAAAVLRNSCFVSLTVLLEIAWVLRSRYALGRSETAAILRLLTSYDSVTVESGEQVGWALDRFSQGGDIADLIHLVSAGPADSFATFDRAVACAAGPDAPVAIETLG